MDLMVEISDITGLPLYLITGSYKYTVIAGQAVHISGSKSILKFSTEQIIFLMQKNKRLVISGSELVLKKMFNADIVVSGKIISVAEE